MGASYGAGNYGMNGRAFDPRFLFTWPSAKSAVMGPAQLAGVLSIVARAAAEARGQEYDDEQDKGMREFVEASVEEQSLPFFLSGMLYDDGVIDPRDTRTVLGICLSVIANTDLEGRRGLRRVPDMRPPVITSTARGQPRARSRDGCSRPAGGSASRPWPCTPTRTPVCRSCARPTSPCACPAARPAETYLRADLVLEAARRTGADAIHPGYGFLSENAAFARAVIDAGLTWVGPSPESIEAMGSKVRAKELMRAAGVPVLEAPGSTGDRRLTEADLPLLVKASAGGGGRGMRVVRDLADLASETAKASAEAESAFGDPHRLRRAVRGARSPRRGAGARSPRRRARPRRARLLDPAPSPESGGGGAGA